MIPARDVAIAALAAAALAACGDGDGDGTGPSSSPSSISVASGDFQVGSVGQPLPNPLVIVVRDGLGRGVSRVVVEFLVATGGGSIAGDVVGALSAVDGRSVTASGVVVLTDSNGNAEVSWTLGTGPGAQTATASVEGLNPIELRALALPGPPTSMNVVSGNNQTGSVLTALDPFVVGLRDQFGNTVLNNLAVDWEVTVGGGVLSSMQTTTNEVGQASTTLTPIQAGAQEVVATASGVAPVTFTATAQ